MPHFDESGWIIQERRIVDFRGSASAHMGNHPMLKLIQILAPVKRCNLLQKGYNGDSEVHDDMETKVELFQGSSEGARLDYGGCCNDES